MHKRALVRLRVGFFVLGFVLLFPLFLLVREAEERFEEQRRLRHEIVAERIFDEMERELSALLEQERQRPSSAYDAANTDVHTWAPFVLGYFKSDRSNLQLVAANQLAPERNQRVQGALAVWQSKHGASLAEETDRKQAPTAPVAKLKEYVDQETVLKQLNRASKRRAGDDAYKQKASPTKNQSDPLMEF